MSMVGLVITVVDTRFQGFKLLQERTQCQWLMECLVVGTFTQNYAYYL